MFTLIPLLEKLLEKFIPAKRREIYLALPVIYRLIKVFSISIFLMLTVFGEFFVLLYLQEKYALNEGIMMIELPLFFASIPFVLLFYNFFFYLISPIRNYFEKVHKKKGLPNFSEANKQLLEASKFFSLPQIPVILLPFVFLKLGFSENVIAVSVIIGTVLMGILGFKLLFDYLE